MRDFWTVHSWRWHTILNFVFWHFFLSPFSSSVSSMHNVLPFLCLLLLLFFSFLFLLHLIPLLAFFSSYFPTFIFGRLTSKLSLIFLLLFLSSCPAPLCSQTSREKRVKCLLQSEVSYSRTYTGLHSSDRGQWSVWKECEALFPNNRLNFQGTTQRVSIAGKHGLCILER